VVKISGGESVRIFTIENEYGRVSLSEFGAAITELWVKDRNGKLRNVILGYDNLEGYINSTSYQGATIGRFANRIKGGFSLNGVYYPLSCNDGDKNLHGYPGFDKRIWKGETAGDNDVVFTRFSPDGEAGFPGNLEVAVKFTFTDNMLIIRYAAKTDKDTPVSLTNHSYFNLSGDPAVPITNTQFNINGTDIPKERLEKGFDESFPLVNDGLHEATFAALAENPDSGIKMIVLTDMPEMQFYTAMNLNEDIRGVHCGPFSAFCFETQFAPDSPNNPEKPSCILKAGETYHSETCYSFKNF
jgi:aldose 1-epimerase